MKPPRSFYPRPESSEESSAPGAAFVRPGLPLAPTSTAYLEGSWWLGAFVAGRSGRVRLRDKRPVGLACGGELLRPAPSDNPLQAGARGLAASADGRAPRCGPGVARAGSDRRHRGRADRRLWVSERVRVRTPGPLAAGGRPRGVSAVAV